HLCSRAEGRLGDQVYALMHIMFCIAADGAHSVLQSVLGCALCSRHLIQIFFVHCEEDSIESSTDRIYCYIGVA
ncbi:hypothetical protein M8C21_006984, partial [Ambrosia artemisiifolia]